MASVDNHPYAAALDSVGYSSGEGIRQYSDSQTVNYGFVALNRVQNVLDVASIDPLKDQVDYKTQESVPQVYGMTPESEVSDYGCVNDYVYVSPASPFYGSKTIELSPQARGNTNPTLQYTGVLSGRGAKFSQDPGTSVTPSPRSDVSDSSTLQQKESAADRQFVGQLGSDKLFKDSPGPIGAHHVGLGLMALAFLL